MRQGNGPSGYLPVNKPSGITSFDVIRELRRQLKIKKLGHSGVLDKPATGVLVVGANNATRLFELFSGFEKTYVADVWLGLSTSTDDTTGELTAVGETALPELGAVEEVLAQYHGTIDQIPPAFSLTKIGGKELYRYALKGEKIEAKPKRVTVVAVECIAYETGIDPAELELAPESKLAAASAQLPPLARLRIKLRCVGGVYVRSLARDIGADLGTCGTLGALVRERVGPFELEDCLTLNDVAEHIAAGNSPAELLLPLGAIAPEDSRIRLDATQLAMVRNGRSIRRFKHHLPPTAEKRGDVVYGMDPGHDLAVILTVGTVNHHGLVELKPAKVLT
jgi:tRNA pseudouridine55 synthase